MIKKLLELVSWLVAGVLLFFTARRWLFTILALLPDRSEEITIPNADFLPQVLLLVPVRNEVESLPELLLALDDLDYPEHKLKIVLIDDGSTDGGPALVQRWIKGRTDWHLLSAGQNLGKSSALNLGLARFPQGELVAIYDADERPLPNALRHLVLPFADQQVGGVSGRRAVDNALASPAATYTAFEGLVHQFVTVRAKDRAQLAPAVLGANCAYRRSALTQVGNFKPGTFLEDSDLTLRLARAGWKTRFVSEAVSYHRVPEKISGYWRQHTRWARGFNEVALDQAQVLCFDRTIRLPLRVELLTFSLGYLDRLALLISGGLIVLTKSRWPLIWILLLSLLTPFVQILAALRVSHSSAAMWRRVVWVPLFFVFDIAMSIAGTWKTLWKTPKIWEERQVRT